MNELLTSLGFATFNKVVLGLGGLAGKKLLQHIAESPASAGEARARLLELADGTPPRESDRELIEKILRDDATLQQSLATLLAQLAEEKEEVKSKLDQILDTILHPKTLAASEPLPTLEKELRGRDADKDRLQKWLWNGKPRILQIAAPSGYGKTALLQAVIAPSSLTYIRRELRKGATAHSVAGDLYECLTSNPARPKFDERLHDLLIALQGRKELLILENLHELLEGSEPKDSEAAALLSALGKSGNRLLVTGWPVSQAFGGDNTIVEDWPLLHIETAAAIQILRDQGVIGEPKIVTLEKVVEQLECNPASLIALAGILRRVHSSQASILDERCEYYLNPNSPLDAMWSYLGLDRQLVLAATCVLRRDSTANRIARMLDWKRDRVSRAFDVLILWKCIVREDDGEYHPTHDTRRNMVKRGMGEALNEIHRRAAAIWLEDGKDIGKDKPPTTQAEIQPLLEVGYHLAQCKDGDAVLDLLWSMWGGIAFNDLIDWCGAWPDLLEFWRCVALHASELQSRASAQHNLGICYQQRGDWNLALSEYQANLSTHQQLGDKQGIARSRHQIGIIHQLQGHYEEALSEYQASLSLFEQCNEQKGIAVSRHQIGMIYQQKGHLAQALTEYLISLKINERLEDLQGIARSRHQIGMVYFDLRQWDEAMSEYQAGLKIHQQLGDQQGIARCRHSIGMVHQQFGRLEEALSEYQASLNLCEQLGDLQGQAMIQGQLGLFWVKKQQFAQAFQHTFLALSIFAQMGDPLSDHSVWNMVGIRQQWGATAFDEAWRKHTGQEVPVELTQAAEAPAAD